MEPLPPPPWTIPQFRAQIALLRTAPKPSDPFDRQWLGVGRFKTLLSGSEYSPELKPVLEFFLPFGIFNETPQAVQYALLGLENRLSTPASRNINWKLLLGVTDPKKTTTIHDELILHRSGHIPLDHFCQPTSSFQHILRAALKNQKLPRPQDREEWHRRLEVEIFLKSLPLISSEYATLFEKARDRVTTDDIIFWFKIYWTLLHCIPSQTPKRQEETLSSLEIFKKLTEIEFLTKIIQMRCITLLQILLYEAEVPKEALSAIEAGQITPWVWKHFNRDQESIAETLVIVGLASRFKILKEYGVKLRKALKRKIPPHHIPAFIRELHQSQIPIPSQTISRILGIPEARAVQLTDAVREDLKKNNGDHQYDYTDPSYEWYRTLMKELDLKSTDTLMDIGSGYGGLALYAASTTEAYIIGIEILEERHRLACTAARAMELGSRITFLQDNMLNADLTRPSVFVVDRSFDAEELDDMMRKLKTEAKKRTFRIVSIGDPNYLLAFQTDWLNLKHVIPHGRRSNPTETTLIFEQNADSLAALVRT